MVLTERLRSLLGPSGWLSSKSEIAPYSRDWLNQCGVPPLGVARPASTQQVAEVMRLCNDACVAVVPQGGRTGLVGASVAAEPETVLLSLSRLDEIEEINPIDFTVTVGAGVVLANLHSALEDADLWLPMHLGSEGSAQIGGLIATNAGGSHAFRYGMMQDLVLGLDVVLPDGKIWNGSRRLIKDNSGFQLRRLFCGSEGRLGIVTRAVLRLQPLARSRATALVALPDIEKALSLARMLRSELAEFLTALEFFDDAILGLALQNISELRWPLGGRAPIYLLVELSCANHEIDQNALLEGCLGRAMETELAIDAVVAQNETQRRQMWHLREELPEGTLREGRQLKHDISVPVSQIPAFLEACAPKLDMILPGVRQWAFGHLGDGNIHYNVSPRLGDAGFAGKEIEINRVVYQTAESVGGSFAAEHGVGRTKQGIADELRSEVERNLMSAIHQLFDPKDLMNPGVVVAGNDPKKS